MNTLNGYSKSTLTDKYVLTAAGGHLAVGNAENNIPLSNGTLNTYLNADLLDGYQASKFVTTDTSQTITGQKHFNTATNSAPLIISRTESANGALITFKNTNGVLGHIGMTGDINGGLVRYTADANLSYTVLDLGNYASLLDQRYYTETESDSRFVNVTGDTMSGSLNTSASKGSWVSGMTDAAIKYNNLAAIDSTSFWKLFNMKSSSGNVVCFGGLGDNIGFHGYYSGRTANATDWRFTVNTNNGVWTSTASIYASHFYESSDVNLKTNIESINTSDNIPLLKSFDWKSDGSHSYGLIALELEELGYSELVSSEGDYKTVNYSAALSLIVGKLQVKIKELEKEIENLKNKN